MSCGTSEVLVIEKASPTVASLYTHESWSGVTLPRNSYGKLDGIGCSSPNITTRIRPGRRRHSSSSASTPSATARRGVTDRA